VTFVEAVAETGGGNGLAVAFYSPGAFAGAPAGLSGGFDSLAYVSHRGASGWSTVPAMPPDTLVPGSITGGMTDADPSLGSVIVIVKPGPSEGVATNEGSVQELLLHRLDTPDTAPNAFEPDPLFPNVPNPGPNWEVVGLPLETVSKGRIDIAYRGGSADFCHLLLEGEGSEGRNSLVPGLANVIRPLYELTRGCDGEPAEVRVVGLNNRGAVINHGTSSEPACPVRPGSESGLAGDGHFNQVAAGGGEIFFATCVGSNGFDLQVFVRLGGQRTVEVSRPLSETCGEGGAQIPCREAATRASAAFAGASEDGSKAFLVTSAPLTGEPADPSENLFMAKLGCPGGEAEACPVTSRTVTGLTRISRDPTAGGQAGVQGVVRVAPDGSRVYFTASGALLSEAEQQALESEGRPAPRAGAENLYVYDGVSERIAFVGDLCSGRELSGLLEDLSCPGAGVDEATLGESQLADPAGRFLVFASHAQLTLDDTDSAKDIYRYDALAGTLERVSLGEGGHDANGNNSAFDATLQKSGVLPELVRAQHMMQVRAISEDGSRIVFTTSEPLSPSAINGLANAYEWHEGAVSLISGGTAESPIDDVTISQSGDDVLFDTTQALVRQDKDNGASDVYDAHLCTSQAPCFPAMAAEPQPCSGDTCYGPLSVPAPLLVPGSVSQAPGGNFAKPSKPASKAKKAKPRKKRRRKKGRRRAKRGRHR
jgi:hypothetical protein